MKTIANADNLGARISDFRLFDAQKNAVSVKKLMDGEYLADANATEFQYEINLAPRSNAATGAHVSWLANEQGILMLDDLLPQLSVVNQTSGATITVEMPDDWKIISGEEMLSANTFRTKNIAKCVFAVGKNWRETKTAKIRLAISGERQFGDAEAARMAEEIFGKYRQLFGETAGETPQIYLAPLPKATKFGRWEAETRGHNLTIVSADKAFKTQSVQLLHEQLRHELFHLWIPNNLNLRGNYDWFYEGFTVYEALRTGLEMNQIRFEDFLATLAEAYRADDFQTPEVSLVESSKNRWNTANSPVYARGMLVAFLCDAAILSNSKGSRSIENVFQEIYRKHRFPNEIADGNTAILNVLKSYQSLDLIVEKYIEGAEKIDWETDLENIGIEVRTENALLKLNVRAKLNSRQKDLLNKLGYNNWRKTSQKSK